jgi:hypothetical protein
MSFMMAGSADGPAPLSVLPSAQYRLKVLQRTQWRLASAIQRELPQQSNP